MSRPFTRSPVMLQVRNLEVVYHHVVQVLRGLSLSVDQGQIVALLGANGAGKTTTLKAVSGLLPLENGEISTGEVIFAQSDALCQAPHQLVRAGLSHVREGRCVFEDMTTEENLQAATYALTGRGGAVADFQVVYDYFPQLWERRQQLAGYLSGGEQQMLALGRALVAQPRLILLDEPSLGLAPRLVEEIFQIIQRINVEQSVSMLLVEQNAAMALAVAHYGYIMENGKVVLEGSSDRLRGDSDVQEFYLGIGRQRESTRSYREVKHYRRRKRWLS